MTMHSHSTFIVSCLGLTLGLAVGCGGDDGGGDEGGSGSAGATDSASAGDTAATGGGGTDGGGTDGATDSAGESGSGGGSGGGGAGDDNVAACESLEDTLAACNAMYDGALMCSTYAAYACDIADYLTCVEDSYGECQNGAFPNFDPSALQACLPLADCG